jgi:nitrogen fixation NifU-like protein
MNDLVDLYQDVILEHSRHPRNFGPCEHATHNAKGNNPLCGDRVSVCLTLDDAGRIEEARFEARGCAISVASASMMTEMIRGMTAAEAKSLFDRFHKLVTGKSEPGADEALAELDSLSGVRAFPTRIKCATLPWHAMTAALEGKDEEVKTE